MRVGNPARLISKAASTPLHRNCLKTDIESQIFSFKKLFDFMQRKNTGFVPLMTSTIDFNCFLNAMPSVECSSLCPLWPLLFLPSACLPFGTRSLLILDKTLLVLLEHKSFRLWLTVSRFFSTKNSDV